MHCPKVPAGLFLLVFLLFPWSKIRAQVAEPVYGPNDTLLIFATRMPDGTLVPTSYMPDVEVVEKMPPAMRKKMRKWTRLKNAVYVTYPYAIAGGRVINNINQNLTGVTDKQVRRKIIQQHEKSLKAAFGDKLMDLSVYQGRVLMKLINRQTGNNCFDLIEEYKGGASARFWQSIAFFFGGSLKQSYHPAGEDAEIESIVKEVALLYRY